MMNESIRLIKNTGIIAAGNMSTKLVTFFLLPLYTSILSTSEYGIIDYIMCISMFCVPLVSVLMDESMFRFLIDCKTFYERMKVVSAAMYIISIAGAVFLLIAFPILYITHYKYSVYFVLFIITSVISTMMSALLRGVGSIKKYAVYNFLMSFINIILNILFIAVVRWGITGMLLASIISHVVVNAIFFVMLRVWVLIDFKVLNKVQAKEMIRYSIPLIPNRISWSIINLSSRIIIMSTIGSGTAGLFAIAYKFPTLMDTIYGFFYQSWKESSARALQEENSELFYIQVYKYLKSFMLSVVLVIIAFLPLAFRFLINQKYQEAIFYVPFLLVATYYSNIAGFYGGIFTAYKDTKIMGTITIVAAVINLSINIAIIRVLGLYAASMSTVIANYVVYIYHKLKVKKYFHVTENRIDSIVTFIVSALIIFLFYSMKVEYQILGCFISVVFTIVKNKAMITLIGRKLVSSFQFLVM